MASNVEFKDFSIEVAAALDETTKAWLLETANEVTAQAQRNCVMEDDAGKRLKGSYANTVDEDEGKATVGTPLEEGYWEEFGTGSYADTTKNGGKHENKQRFKNSSESVRSFHGTPVLPAAASVRADGRSFYGFCAFYTVRSAGAEAGLPR